MGFEPTVRLPVRLISSQVPLTTQPPFQLTQDEHITQAQYVPNGNYYARLKVLGKVIRLVREHPVGRRPLVGAQRRYLVEQRGLPEQPAVPAATGRA